MSTKVAFVADVHVGNHQRHGGAILGGVNTRCWRVLKALQRASEAASRHACGAFVVLGDLFDTAEPRPQVVAAAMRALDATGHMLPTGAILLAGNHDKASEAKGDHALAPFDASGVAHVVETPRVAVVGDAELLLVPYHAGDAREWLPEAVRVGMLNHQRHMKHRMYLCTHVGVIDRDTPAWLRDAHDAVPVELLRQIRDEHNLQGVFTGNWHSHKTWDGDSIVQVGALVPTGWDNPGEHYGNMVIVEGRKLTVMRVDETRFVRAVGIDAPEAKDALRNDEWQTFLHWTVAPDDLEEARELADMSEHLVVSEVLPDGARAGVAVRKAAAIARSADSLREALVGFVDKMPIPDGVDRAAVKRRALQYLGDG